MNIAYYHVDAFTSELFHGNPACSIPYEYMAVRHTHARFGGKAVIFSSSEINI